MIIHCKYDDLLNPKSLKQDRSHPKNRNKHPKEQIERLAKILSYQGWRYAVKISNQSGLITSGHGRIDAAILNKWKEVPVVYQDYESEEQEYADVQADNAIASWAELDLAGVNLDVPDLGPDFDIDLLGIKDFVIEPADKYGDQDADAVPDSRPTNICDGDLYALGSHRLLCADSTDPKCVERLMNGEKADMVYTDPPYGMKYDPDWTGLENDKRQAKIQKFRPNQNWESKRKYRPPVIGDDKDFDPSFILEAFKSTKEIFLWGADYYAERLITKNEGSWVVWDKRVTETMDKGFGSCFELCWSKTAHKREIARITWLGVFGRDEGAAGHEMVHPTQKPIKLAEWFFERWGKDKINIVDLYLGSGSTLIACEKTNRKCFGIEIDPQYCQVIIDRWEKFTGQKAQKI